MKPQAPAITIERPSNLTGIVWTDAELQECFRNLEDGTYIEVMDATGISFDVRPCGEGQVEVTHRRTDSSKLRSKLMMMAGAEHSFDPSEMKSAVRPDEMFTAYKKQIMLDKPRDPTGDKPAS